MVLDADDRACAFFKGACTRGIYDNMKTAVDTIMVGRAHAYNRHLQQMCSHYLVDPVACTPASGWGKGQVENQVDLVRERFRREKATTRLQAGSQATAPAGSPTSRSPRAHAPWGFPRYSPVGIAWRRGPSGANKGDRISGGSVKEAVKARKAVI